MEKGFVLLDFPAKIDNQHIVICTYRDNFRQKYHKQ